MNAKLQSYLILLGTLVIGMVLGFLINGQIVKNRLEHTRGFLSDREGRIEHILEEVEMSEEQKEAIQPILKLHFERMFDIHQEHRQEFRSEFMQLRSKLGNTWMKVKCEN